jgi:hypothetical protein
MNTNLYETSDFYLASYLLSVNVPIVDTTRDSEGKVTFIFQKTENFEQLIDDFLTFKAKVEPLAYASAQKKLKHLIYFKE